LRFISDNGFTQVNLAGDIPPRGVAEVPQTTFLVRLNPYSKCETSVRVRFSREGTLDWLLASALVAITIESVHGRLRSRGSDGYVEVEDPSPFYRQDRDPRSLANLMGKMVERASDLGCSIRPVDVMTSSGVPFDVSQQAFNILEQDEMVVVDDMGFRGFGRIEFPVYPNQRS
jgi:hypothetical protein